MTQPLQHQTPRQLPEPDLRDLQIQAIHDLADWYRKHPDEPMPAHIIATSTSWEHQDPEADRVAAVLNFVTRHGGRASESAVKVVGEVELPTPHDLEIVILRTAYLDNQAGRGNRYVFG